MNYRKPVVVAAAALSMSTSPLHASGAAAPRMEPEVMEPAEVTELAAASSTGGFVIPLLFLVIIAAAASSSGMPRE